MDYPQGIEKLVAEDITKRQQLGHSKYGQMLTENPAGRRERIQHAYEEALDLAIYLRWELSKLDGAGCE